MSEIHYFPRYSTKENAVTNNTLLLLLRLYQYNRYKFEKLMEILGTEQEVPLPNFGLQFNQQTTTGKSVLDGFLWQESIKIAVETKLGSSFDIEQLKNHLAAFKDEQHKFFILLNPTSESGLDSQLTTIRDVARPRNIQVIHATFADIVAAARKCLPDYDEEMLALVDDFESFCSERELLPRDQYTIFVPPCGQSIEENIKYRLYYCPVTRTIRNAKYLGIYASKTIQAIGKITKLVACDVDVDAKIVKEHKDHQKLTDNEKQRILDASTAAKQHGWDLSRDHRFFLCDDMAKTDFPKTSPGSMMGRRYLDIQEILGDRKIPDNLDELAALLRQHEWK